MLTGTPLDLTFIPELLAWLGYVIPIVWLLLLVMGLVLTWRQTRTKLGRGVGVMLVLGMLVAAPAWLLVEWRHQSLVEQAKRHALQATSKAELARAEALFEKRCKTAGEFIDRAVPNVKGIVWMKWRSFPTDLDGQFRTDDPFGHDCSGEACFKQLLVATEGKELPYEGEYLVPYGKGYEFVEATDPSDGQMYRYRLRLYRPHDRDPNWAADDVKSELIKEPIVKASAQFGLTWEDISTREDRLNWIAGGALRVVDLHTNEVIATRIGFMMDRGLGAGGGSRAPWGFAGDHACPPRVDDQGKRTEVGFSRRFLFKVAQPVNGGR